ncbi:Inner membrane ABC transporter permease protein ytfT [Ewingella americana]|uniref:Inner membrane ABC transporter permease protein ytfT n=1 Tax=Ewingella americana TaxID=41202 RepID=A0A377NG87_9GAMM|nr:Inner membrane ABC transporter permease protein ytfT [Ewingella americana]
MLLNNVAPLAIAALAMTLVTSMGAVDLSIGTSIDFACLVLVTLVLHQVALPVALFAALLAALGVGLFNAFLVAILASSLSSPPSARCLSVRACSSCLPTAVSLSIC